MPKTLTAEPDTSQQDETKKQRKKQAKKEAKVMLKVERTKKEVGKAQKKLTRAQSNLDASQTHLHKLEEQLQQIRAPEAQTPSDATSEASQTQEVIDDVYQEPLLVPASTSPQADTEITEAFPAFTPFEEQSLTQAETDEQNTPSLEDIAGTDTTSPEDTEANGNSTLSPYEAQTLVEHGNEEPELSNNPNASSPEESVATTTESEA